MFTAGLGWSHRTRLAMVELQQRALIVVDGARILANVAGAVDAARQLLEVPALNGFEGADADLRRFGNLLKRDAPIRANRSQAEHAFLFCHLPALPSEPRGCWTRERSNEGNTITPLPPLIHSFLMEIRRRK